MHHELTDHFHLGADLAGAWRFFSAAENLPRITPQWLAFTLRTPGQVEIRQDSILDYTIKWMGLPVKWRTKIIDWTPPRQFIDLQIRGPYALWHHQHRFEPADDGGTVCFDRVIYRLPVFGLRRILHSLVVRKHLLEIFRYRRKAIGERLGWVRAVQSDVETRPF